MTQTIEAVFENNVLKPIIPLEGLEEHQRVQLTLNIINPATHLKSLAGTLSAAEAEEMQVLIEKEFEQVENEW